MKRFGILLLAAMMLLLTACGGGGSSPEPDSSGDTAQDAPVEKYKFIFAHGMSTDTCFGPLGDAIKQGLEDSGLFEVEVYPAGALGSESECIQSMQIGDIQAYCTAAASYSGYSNAMYVFDRMFAFTDAEQARKVVNDPDFLAAFNEKLAEVNFHVVCINDLGFRQTFSSKPIESIEDFQGMSFRTMENKVHMQGWSDVGAKPTPLSFSELYTALQQGVVTGHENVLSSAYSSKVYEVQPYMVETNHIFNANCLVVNNDWYQALSEEARTVFDQVMWDARDVMLTSEAELTDTYLQAFEAAGMTIRECPVEMHNQLLARMEPSYELCRELTGADLYDLFTATMEKYQ